MYAVEPRANGRYGVAKFNLETNGYESYGNQEFPTENEAQSFVDSLNAEENEQ